MNWQSGHCLILVAEGEWRISCAKRDSVQRRGSQAFASPRFACVLRCLGPPSSTMMTSELSPSSMRSWRSSVLTVPAFALPLPLGRATVLSWVLERVPYEREGALPLFDSSPELETSTSEVVSRALPLPLREVDAAAEPGRAEVDAAEVD